MNETSGADMRDCTKTRRTNVFVSAKKKKTDQDKEPGPRRAEVPASYLFLPADTAYKTQGHDHEVINTRCTSTSINAANDGGHS